MSQATTTEHRTRYRRLWLAFALLMIGIAVLVFQDIAEDVREGTLRTLDLLAFSLIAAWRSPALTWLAWVFSHLLVLPYALIFVLPVTLLLLAARRCWEALGLLVIPLFALLVVNGLKQLIERPRPAPTLALETGLSFPSGHATLAVVIYGYLGYLAWRFLVRHPALRALVILLVILLILATGLARVYLGVHYFSDVVAGWAAGSGILASSLLILETMRRQQACS
jgi:undecaprenyl-diphosphatase